jgi:hypothetical protein
MAAEAGSGGWDYYKTHIGPVVNGLLVLIPASCAFIYYMAEASWFYSNALHRRNNTPELTSTDMLRYRVPMVVGIFLVSSFITSRSTKDRRLATVIILNLIGTCLLVGIAVQRQTAVEIVILALVAIGSGSVGHVIDRIAGRHS